MSNERGKIVDVEGLFARGQECLQGAGCRVDPRKAQRLFAIAARAGHAGGQFHLAMMLRSGQGGAVDANEAAMWLKRAAEQGHGRAQFELAGLYRVGEGVRKNRVLALRWFILVGDENAALQCALVAHRLTERQQRRAMRMALKRKLRHDLNRVTEELLEESGLLPGQSEPEPDDEKDLPRFVRLTPPVP